MYDDGGIYCFSCSEFLKDKDSDDGTKESKQVLAYKKYKLPELTEVDLTLRGIDAATSRKYSVGEYNDYVYFPTFKDKVCLGAKTRRISTWENKDYWREGNNIGLFGMQTRKPTHKSVIIVEGEFDALAADIMYGLEHCCVSITNGAPGAARAIKSEIEWVNSFDQVYFCFDNDSVGQEAIPACLQYIKPGKARIALLRPGYKDANDMLKAGKAWMFREDIQSAAEVRPDEVLTSRHLRGKAVEYIKQTKIESANSTGFKGLDTVLGGFNPGEVVVLAAHTGVGKTTLALQLALNALEKGLKVMIFTLETSPGAIIAQLCEMLTKQLVYSGRNPALIPEENYEKELTWLCERVTVYNRMGSLSLEKMQEHIEYVAMTGGADVLVLDHITAATQTLEGKQVQVIDAMMSMLNYVSVQHGIWSLIISHVSRDSDDRSRQKLTLNSIRNSEGIAQYAHCVIGMTRPMDSLECEISVLKGHRKYGNGGHTFKLTWDEVDRCYYEGAKITNVNIKQEAISEVTDNQASEQDTVEQQIQSTTECLGGRVDQVSFAVREGDTPEPPDAPVRAITLDVHSNLSTRLHAFYEDRQNYLRGSERIFTPRGQSETSRCGETEPYGILEAAISEFFKPSKEFFKQWADLRGMGNSTQVCVV